MITALQVLAMTIQQRLSRARQHIFSVLSGPPLPSMGMKMTCAPWTPSTAQLSTVRSLHSRKPNRPKGVSNGCSARPGVMAYSPAVVILR